MVAVGEKHKFEFVPSKMVCRNKSGNDKWWNIRHSVQGPLAPRVSEGFARETEPVKGTELEAGSCLRLRCATAWQE